MTTTPVYTTKAAIIIGVAVTLVVGLAIGSTVIAKMMDDNRLARLEDRLEQLEISVAELETSPKFVSFVTLNDDANGNAAGWNPGATTGDRQVFDFNITDDKVNENSIVYATFVVPHQLLWDYDGLPPLQEPEEVACFTNPAVGSFTVHCAYQQANGPSDGSPLKYVVIQPSQD